MASAREIAETVYAAFNTGRYDQLDEVIAEDFIEHAEVPGIPQTRDGVKQWGAMMRSAFPDLHMELLDLIEQDNRAAALLRMTGTHQGEFMGMPPTGRRFEVLGLDYVRMRDGKVVEHWGMGEDMKMMAQLGTAVPQQQTVELPTEQRI